MGKRCSIRKTANSSLFVNRIRTLVAVSHDAKSEIGKVLSKPSYEGTTVPKRGKAVPKIEGQKIDPQKKDNSKRVDSSAKLIESKPNRMAFRSELITNGNSGLGEKASWAGKGLRVTVTIEIVD